MGLELVHEQKCLWLPLLPAYIDSERLQQSLSSFFGISASDFGRAPPYQRC